MSTIVLSKRQYRDANRKAQAYPDDRKENAVVVPRHCSKCNRFGHTDAQCWECGKCGRFGHKSETCRIVECSKCNRSGHSEDKCWECGTCGRFGHRTEACRTPLCGVCGCFGHKSETCRLNLFCLRCRRIGHEEEYCRTRPWCWACREEHHPGHCDQIAMLDESNEEEVCFSSTQPLPLDKNAIHDPCDCECNYCSELSKQMLQETADLFAECLNELEKLDSE